MKIVMHDPLPLDEYLAAVQDAAPSAEIVVASKENVVEELRDAEIFFGFHSPEVFRQATKLRWIQATSAGIEALLVPELVARGPIITNASGLYASPVIEAAWALTLALFRRIPTYLRQQQEHRWEVQIPGRLGWQHCRRHRSRGHWESLCSGIRCLWNARRFRRSASATEARLCRISLAHG